MTEEMKALALRAVSNHTRWSWLPGMKAMGSRDNPKAWFRLEEPQPRLTGEWRCAVPDLEDAATLGAMLVLYSESRLSLERDDPVFESACHHGMSDIRTVNALVLALESA